MKLRVRLGAAANKQEDFFSAPQINVVAVVVAAVLRDYVLASDDVVLYIIFFFFGRFTLGREDSAKNFAAISYRGSTQQRKARGEH